MTPVVSRGRITLSVRMCVSSPPPPPPDLHAVPMTTKSCFYFCVWLRVTTLINSRLTDKPYHFEDTLEKADRLQPIGIMLQPIDNSRPAPEQVVGMEVMEPLGP